MAGYSATPLIKKLGLKDGFHACVYHGPTYYFELLGAIPTSVDFSAKTDCDFIHAFYKERPLLERELNTHMETIKQDGMIWISWPKKASKVQTDITEDVVREAARPLGLVDVKVCAVDGIWSGLKLVIRKELR